VPAGLEDGGFRLETIQKHISEELRDELTRTEELEKHTITASEHKLKWYYKVFPSSIYPAKEER
jgi:hypothetical protein